MKIPLLVLILTVCGQSVFAQTEVPPTSLDRTFQLGEVTISGATTRAG